MIVRSFSLFVFIALSMTSIAGFDSSHPGTCIVLPNCISDVNEVSGDVISYLCSGRRARITTNNMAAVFSIIDGDWERRLRMTSYNNYLHNGSILIGNRVWTNNISPRKVVRDNKRVWEDPERVYTNIFRRIVVDVYRLVEDVHTRIRNLYFKTPLRTDGIMISYGTSLVERQKDWISYDNLAYSNAVKESFSAVTNGLWPCIMDFSWFGYKPTITNRLSGHALELNEAVLEDMYLDPILSSGRLKNPSFGDVSKIFQTIGGVAFSNDVSYYVHTINNVSYTNNVSTNSTRRITTTIPAFTAPLVASLDKSYYSNAYGFNFRPTERIAYSSFPYHSVFSTRNIGVTDAYETNNCVEITFSVGDIERSNVSWKDTYDVSIYSNHYAYVESYGAGYDFGAYGSWHIKIVSGIGYDNFNGLIGDLDNGSYQASVDWVGGLFEYGVFDGHSWRYSYSSGEAPPKFFFNPDDYHAEFVLNVYSDGCSTGYSIPTDYILPFMSDVGGSTGDMATLVPHVSQKDFVDHMAVQWAASIMYGTQERYSAGGFNCTPLNIDGSCMTICKNRLANIISRIQAEAGNLENPVSALNSHFEKMANSVKGVLQSKMLMGYTSGFVENLYLVKSDSGYKLYGRDGELSKDDQDNYLTWVCGIGYTDDLHEPQSNSIYETMKFNPIIYWKFDNMQWR